MLTWKRVIPGRRDESPQTGGLKGLSSMRAAIPGTPPKLPLLGRYLSLPGNHRLDFLAG
jgi:hypothetical protein